MAVALIRRLRLLEPTSGRPRQRHHPADDAAFVGRLATAVRGVARARLIPLRRRRWWAALLGLEACPAARRAANHRLREGFAALAD
jgi:hypothetical protein